MVLEISGSAGTANTLNDVNINLNHISHTIGSEGSYSVVMNNRDVIRINKKDYLKITVAASIWNMFVVTGNNDYMEELNTILSKLD